MAIDYSKYDLKGILGAIILISMYTVLLMWIIWDIAKLQRVDNSDEGIVKLLTLCPEYKEEVFDIIYKTGELPKEVMYSFQNNCLRYKNTDIKIEERVKRIQLKLKE